MAFPTTSVLDDADRADENPLFQGGNWTTVAELGAMRVASNQFAASAAFAASYRGLYADAEVYVTLATLAGDMQIGTRFQDAGGASPIRDSRRRGYQLIGTSTQYTLQRMDDGNNVTLIALTNWPGGALSGGDSIGLSSTEDIHEIWLKRGAGDWASVTTYTDDTYTNAGAIYMQCSSTSARLDNFGGGLQFPQGNIRVPRHGIGMGRW